MGLEEIRKLKQQADIKSESQAGLPKPDKTYRGIAKKSQKKLAQEAAAKDEAGDTDLVKWFRKKMETSQAICENCGKFAGWIKKPEYKKLWHSSQAHILPRAIFESVKCHPLNHVVLFPGFSQACNCHDVFDLCSQEDRELMPVWKKCIPKIVMMFPDLTEEEVSRLPQSIIDYINDHQPF